MHKSTSQQWVKDLA